jgi:hypothetical protein
VAFTGCVEFRRVVHLVVEALAQQQGAQFTCFPGTKAQKLTLSWYKSTKTDAAHPTAASSALRVQPLRYY